MHLVFFFASEVFFALLSILQNSRFFGKLSFKFFFANRVCEMLNSSSVRLSWFYILCSMDGLCLWMRCFESGKICRNKFFDGVIVYSTF